MELTRLKGDGMPPPRRTNTPPNPRDSDPGADEGLLSPLERALIREHREDRASFSKGMEKLESAIGKVYENIPDKKLVYVLAGAVVILLFFSVALLALQLGQDPRIAAEAAHQLMTPLVKP